MKIEIIDNLETYRKEFYIDGQEVFTKKKIEFCNKELIKKLKQTKPDLESDLK